MPRPSHPSWLDYSNYTWRSVQVMKRILDSTRTRTSTPLSSRPQPTAIPAALFRLLEQRRSDKLRNGSHLSG
jgi:hypothetical protein